MDPRESGPGAPDPARHDGPPSPAPAPPRLGAAADHRGAAEAAAEARDFDRALRERFRAVLRGLEQRGMLEVRRSRTADETVHDVSTASGANDLTSELQPAAHSFDEVVYGGRRATEDEYRRLEFADRFSASAPPPTAEPVETAPVEVARRRRPTLPPVPELLRNPKFWAVVIGSIAVVLLLWALSHAMSAPDAPQPPPQPDLPPPPDPDTDYDPSFGEGRDSLFERLPAPIAFGGLQLLFALALLVWWRARRRGALVGEPRPVEVAAGELLAGQAALYRRAGQPDHVAAKLRATTLRRLRPSLGVPADAGPDRIVAAIASRTGLDPAAVGAALYGPVPDDRSLRHVADQLGWIEAHG